VKRIVRAAVAERRTHTSHWWRDLIVVCVRGGGVSLRACVRHLVFHGICTHAAVAGRFEAPSIKASLSSWAASIRRAAHLGLSRVSSSPLSLVVLLRRGFGHASSSSCIIMLRLRYAGTVLTRSKPATNAWGPRTSESVSGRLLMDPQSIGLPKSVAVVSGRATGSFGR
jgi:hypothetical protein